MTYQIKFSGDLTFAYLDNKQVGKFDTDIFLERVISPLEFKRFESNPIKTNFQVRQLEFNIFKIK